MLHVKDASHARSILFAASIGLALGVGLASLPTVAHASSKARTAGQETHDPEQLLEKALRALKAGKLDEALRTANLVLHDGKRDPRNTARAMGVRGSVYLKQKRLAEAISDLDSALWVKDGLIGSERRAATEARTKAYQLIGASAPSPSHASASSAPSAQMAQTATAQSATGSWSSTTQIQRTRAQPAASEAPSQGNAITNFFSNLFGQSQSSSTGSLPGRSDVAGVATMPPPTEPKRLSALSSYAPQSAVPLPTHRPAAAEAAPAPSKRIAKATPRRERGGRQYQLKLAAVRTMAEAQQMGSAVKATHGAELDGSNVSIQKVTFGQMGTFYRPQIGPFSSRAKSKTVCDQIRSSGTDCMVVTE
ncbi:MAG: SPOR domain-containing protein [Hyphomicrobiaceae bacterium]